MKAIHNAMQKHYNPLQTVFNISKIQNESNSQLLLPCVNSKITVFNTSKIQNESNSQLVAGACENIDDCKSVRASLIVKP